MVRGVYEANATEVDVYFPGGENEIWVSATSDDVQTGTGLVTVSVTRENVNMYF